MANVVDLLGSTEIIAKRNKSISKPFMFYQLFGMISSILGPSTICLMVAGKYHLCVLQNHLCTCEFVSTEMLFEVKMDTTLKHDKYLAGSLTFVLDINSAAALVISVIPPAIYLGLCFKLKSDTQITIAAILSLCYAFLMLTVTISIIGMLCLIRFNL